MDLVQKRRHVNRASDATGRGWVLGPDMSPSHARVPARHLASEIAPTILALEPRVPYRSRNSEHLLSVIALAVSVGGCKDEESVHSGPARTAKAAVAAPNPVVTPGASTANTANTSTASTSTASTSIASTGTAGTSTASTSTASEDAPPAAASPTARETCAVFDAGRKLGQLQHPELREISGVVASRRHRDVLYVHNDSGDSARFFAIGSTGALRGEFRLSGARVFDVEDIAIGAEAGSDHDWIYLADSGDNFAREVGIGRKQIRVFRTAEPQRLDASAPVLVQDWQQLVFTYSDGAHDCEAIAVDPPTGDLYFVTKENDGRSHAFVSRAPQQESARVLEQVARFDYAPELPSWGRMVTAMDISADGTALILRSYVGARLWRRDPNTPWADVLRTPGKTVPAMMEPQGEAIAFHPRGLSYFTTSEGVDPLIWYYAEACDSVEPPRLP